MASLIVRRLDDDLVRRLKARALAQGRSAEAEHRAILEAALRPGLSGRERTASGFEALFAQADLALERNLGRAEEYSILQARAV